MDTGSTDTVKIAQVQITCTVFICSDTDTVHIQIQVHFRLTVRYHVVIKIASVSKTDENSHEITSNITYYSVEYAGHSNIETRQICQKF